VLKLRVAIQENPTFAEPYRVLAACYAHMGRLDDARDVVEQLRTVTPAVMPDASQFRSAEHRELWISGLRLAMIGETA
jgi:adenylate cyclase